VNDQKKLTGSDLKKQFGNLCLLCVLLAKISVSVFADQIWTNLIKMRWFRDA
jgi:hypothetical protein